MSTDPAGSRSAEAVRRRLQHLAAPMARLFCCRRPSRTSAEISRREPMRLSLMPKKSVFFTLISRYTCPSIRPAARRQAHTLRLAAQEMVIALQKLEKLNSLEPHWIKIHTLENEGDAIFREAVADLFARSTDPVEIIKWKDIHGLIEVAVDRCEDVANIVEMIVVKHK